MTEVWLLPPLVGVEKCNQGCGAYVEACTVDAAVSVAVTRVVTSIPGVTKFGKNRTQSQKG